MKRKCKYCGEKYEPKFNSLEPCPKKECKVLFFSDNQAKIIARAKKQAEKHRKAAKKQAKEEITDWGAKLQDKVQDIIRLIDFEQPCLARQYIPKQTHSGHVVGRGSAANMKYNLHNMFAQSAQSNHFQNDDGLMRDGVKREFGEDYLEFIFSLKQTPIIKRFDEELKLLYRHACKVFNRIKKHPKKLTNLERIEYRNQLNLELGIYPEEYCVYNNKKAPN